MHYLSVRPSIMLFLLEAAKGCLSKSSKRFTEHCMNHKLITKNQKVQKCKSLSRLLLNFQPSVITEKRCPLRANHWQVSEKHFTQAWISSHKYAHKTHSKTHTVTLSGVITITRREQYTSVPLCCTSGKASSHIKWLPKCQMNGGLLDYLRHESIFLGQAFSFQTFKLNLAFFTKRWVINGHIFTNKHTDKKNLLWFDQVERRTMNMSLQIVTA